MCDRTVLLSNGTFFNVIYLVTNLFSDHVKSENSRVGGIVGCVWKSPMPAFVPEPVFSDLGCNFTVPPSTGR